MEQNTKPLTLEEAATCYAKMLFPGGGPNYLKAEEDFINGGEWQKKQDKEILNVANQLLRAFHIRYPNEPQLLVGWDNENAFDKINKYLYPNY